MGAVAEKIDLHAHTVYSDGTFTPAESVSLALERELTTLAITDHDSTEGLPEAFRAADGTALEMVPGTEFSTVWDGQGVHVLAYWPDLEHEEFQTELRRLREDRFTRGERMVGRLRDLGYPVTFERVSEIAGGGAIGRPHVARALVEAGVIAETDEAFTPELIGSGGRAYIEKHALDPLAALALIKRAGAVAVIAHPGLWREGLGVRDELIEELAANGLDGIEAAHTDHTPEMESRYREMARRLDLVATGSSDCHGTLYDPVRLGMVTTDPGQYARLRERARV
jgi:predicted metal-dependent phosphoesterase TrpH